MATKKGLYFAGIPDSNDASEILVWLPGSTSLRFSIWIHPNYTFGKKNAGNHGCDVDAGAGIELISKDHA